METLSIGKRIKQRRTELGLKQLQIKELTGISSGNLSDIENGKKLPSTPALLALSKALNCSIDWILKGNSLEDENISLSNKRIVSQNNFYYSPKEEKLLSVYRQLSPLNQEKELARMETLVEVVKEETIIYKAVPLLGFSAAGTPIQAIDPNEYQLLQTTKLKADFALSIKGHSMEPMITDGSIIFVHQTPHLENGEIGVFQINNTSFSTDEEVTCKIFKQLAPDHIQLLSVNPEYPAIDINPAEQGLKILGKVIL